MAPPLAFNNPLPLPFSPHPSPPLSTYSSLPSPLIPHLSSFPPSPHPLLHPPLIHSFTFVLPPSPPSSSPHPPFSHPPPHTHAHSHTHTSHTHTPYALHIHSTFTPHTLHTHTHTHTHTAHTHSAHTPHSLHIHSTHTPFPSQSSKDILRVAEWKDVECYTGTQYKKFYRAPGNYCFSLVVSESIGPSPSLPPLVLCFLAVYVCSEHLRNLKIVLHEHSQNLETACQSLDCAANLEFAQYICTISRLREYNLRTQKTIRVRASELTNGRELRAI